MFYRKHIFFCTNVREDGTQCCGQFDAKNFCKYTKQCIKKLGLSGENGIRVSLSGCLGRCSQGPAIVIYPEGTWYTYKNQADIDEIITSHLLNNKIVERLLI